MYKRVLITSGPVYAHLDDNKILSSIVRGKWSSRFSDYLLSKGHGTCLIGNMDYHQYRDQCVREAMTSDAAVMAAAVINYIPENPFQGKMPTDAERVTVTLKRSPYVIDEIRKVNPKCKLIGCKLTSRESPDALVQKAQSLMDRSRAHAIIANDRSNLKHKYLCFPDGAVLPFDNDFDGLYSELTLMIEDIHFSTDVNERTSVGCPDAERLMGTLLDRYSGRFSKPWAGKTRSFGSMAVRIGAGANTAIMTPRTKSDGVSIKDCPVIEMIDGRLFAYKNSNGMESLKATANAPLLLEVLRQYPEAPAVIHLHEKIAYAETVSHAPPGTIRDSNRGDLPSKFNIDHHGFVACVNANGDIV